MVNKPIIKGFIAELRVSVTSNPSMGVEEFASPNMPSIKNADLFSARHTERNYASDTKSADETSNAAKKLKLAKLL